MRVLVEPLSVLSRCCSQVRQDNSMVERKVFFKMRFDNWISTLKRMKLHQFLLLHSKINSKWTKYLNISAKTVTFLEDMSTLLQSFIRKCLRYDTKSTSDQRKEIDKLNLIQIKSFCISKIPLRKCKVTIGMNKIFANLLSLVKLVSRIFKEHWQLNNPKKYKNKKSN